MPWTRSAEATISTRDRTQQQKPTRPPPSQPGRIELDAPWKSMTQPRERIHQESLLQGWTEIRTALKHEVAAAELGRERAGAHPAIVIAAVTDADIDVRTVDDQPVRLATMRLEVRTHDSGGRRASIERVIAQDVPVAHPGRAQAADLRVVGEGAFDGELTRDAVGQAILLRQRQKRRAGLDRGDDSRREFARCGRRAGGALQGETGIATEPLRRRRAVGEPRSDNGGIGFAR